MSRSQRAMETDGTFWNPRLPRNEGAAASMRIVRMGIANPMELTAGLSPARLACLQVIEPTCNRPNYRIDLPIT